MDCRGAEKVIAMLRNPEFDSKEVDPDLHKRLEKAGHDGRIKCFNMREGRADGDQDLNFWTSELEDVVLENGRPSFQRQPEFPV